MAFTEKYVTVAGAGAHDGTSEANAWTFAEMITAAPAAGNRVNVKAGSYSVGAYTIGAGTAAAPFVIRGFNSTIGDLDNQGRNADGTLNTSNMPDITVTTAWVPAALCVIQNIDFLTTTLASAIISSSTIDNGHIISCRMVNSNNHASARALQVDQGWQLTNCDFECSGADHNSVVACEGVAWIYGCRFKGVTADNLLELEGGLVDFSTFVGNSGSTNKGAVFDGSSTTQPPRVINCTFYHLAAAIQFPNSVNSFFPTLINNHCTDCTAYLDNLYTSNIGLVDYNSRTRDAGSLPADIEIIQAGVVTTDTGGAETDYTNAGSEDFTLISTAPGKEAGMPSYLSIGANQPQASAAGGGLMISNPMRGGVL